MSTENRGIITKELFLDEFGTPSLECQKDNVSDYYIIAGVLIDSDKQNDLIDSLRKIKKQFNVQGEIKSSNYNKQPEKRLALLGEFSKLDMHYIYIAIDKTKLDKDSGLKWKHSFIKNMGGLLYSLLSKYHDELSVYSDNLGRKHFHESYKSYISRKDDNLFSDDDLKFVDSKSKELVQVADLIAGTLGRVYELNRKDDYSTKFWDAISKKIILERVHPLNYEPLFYQKTPTNEHDRAIKVYAERQVEKFIRENKQSKDENTIAQVETLEYLVRKMSFNSPDEYSYASKITDYLSELLGTSKMSDDRFRQDVISELRDAGVIISSCRNGYKIPSGLGDIVKFVEQINLNIIPMVNRLDYARKQIKTATNNKLDIIEEFENLQVLLNRHEEYHSNKNFDVLHDDE